jgi:hypothetical protein
MSEAIKTTAPNNASPKMLAILWVCGRNTLTASALAAPIAQADKMRINHFMVTGFPPVLVQMIFHAPGRP